MKTVKVHNWISSFFGFSCFELQLEKTVGWLSPKGDIGITPFHEVINPVMILRPLKTLNEPFWGLT